MSSPLAPPQAALDLLREDWPEYVEYWEHLEDSESYEEDATDDC